MFVLVSNKWSNFLHENLVDLRNEGILCDVTLSGSDGQIQLAHSSILAAASTVFKSCLVQAPRGHYVVKIPSITSQMWEQLLQFIYRGKVKVTADEKDALLTASTTLGLSELQSLLKACSQEESEVGSMKSTVITTDPKPSRAEAIFGSEAPSTNNTLAEDGQVLSTQQIESVLSTKAVENAKQAAKTNTIRATKYTCTLCGKSFPWGKSLHIHELMHKNKKTAKHPCTVCSKTFLSYHSLSAHQRTHNFHPFKCEECNTGFHFHVNYELHMWKKHMKQVSGDVYKCNTCAKTFVAKGLLQRHLSQSHGFKKPKLSQSPDKKSLKSALVSVCGLCDEKCMSRTLMQSHFQSEHQLENPQFCDICDKAFESSDKVLQHYQEHLGKSEPKSSETAAAVMTIREDVPGDSAPFKCQVCHIECKSMRLLSKHMRTHEGQVTEDLWKCPVCFTEFDNKPDFSMHIAEHRGEKTFICKYCGKGFTHKGNYSTHIHRHLGIKPFTCTFCPKTFVRKDDMKSHMRVHTGEKPYPCQVCNVKFSCISNLREHERAKHNISFSKRNPNIVVPRQHRPKVKYRSKNVAQFNITHPSDDLLQMGIIQELSSSSSSAPNTQPLLQTTGTELPQQNAATDPVTQFENKIIVRDGGQEEYYQVVESVDGIQTLAPALQYDHQKIAPVTFTIDGSEMAKMEGNEMVPMVIQSGGSGDAVIISEDGKIMTEGPVIISDNQGTLIEGGGVISEGGVVMTKEAPKIEDSDVLQVVINNSNGKGIMNEGDTIKSEEALIARVKEDTVEDLDMNVTEEQES